MTAASPRVGWNVAERSTPIRVLIAKVGLDGHDRGAKVLARGLRDEGFEVIYSGLRRTIDDVVSAAIEEDVDVVGCSILSGAHATLLPKLVAGLRAAGAGNVVVVAGGIIPEADRPSLHEVGIKAIFGPGTTIGEVAAFLRANVSAA
jgi:methylmalonyl-CoA mutase C-terminal domain/subunit